ncbi:unnamed protein product [Clonostachys solani]|uniref:Uncharacterized protein n=1 Tax=Clonostachys solani TaxID=160281 RepID=A0A9N9W7B5_9HYPO|nr:unnamed protein product [Clonostachys solani]
MDKLSQELVDIICDYLESTLEGQKTPKLAPYACISRQWKAAVERKTFALMPILFPEADDFVALVDSGRARYVREVHFHANTRFPAPGREGRIGHPDYGYVGASVIKDVYQIELLADLATVMKHMSEWEIEYPIVFSISGTCIRFDEDSPPLEFPIVKNIRTFRCLIRTTDPVDICKLATRMPELRKFSFSIPHHKKRQNSRLADEIGTWGEKLPQLESLEIMGEHDTFSRQRHLHRMGDMRNEDGVDRLCQELRLLSQKRGFKRLRTEYVPISRELFEDTQNPTAKMSWPTLEEFTVLFHEMSSTGEWYLTDEPMGQGPNQDLRFKHDEAAVAPILELFTRAISLESSPSLKRAGLGFQIALLEMRTMLASFGEKEEEPDFLPPDFLPTFVVGYGSLDSFT